MPTLSVPMPVHLEQFIDQVVKQGGAPTKAEVVRRAVARYAEDEAVRHVMEAMQELKDGKILRGDLRELMKRIK